MKQIRNRLFYNSCNKYRRFHILKTTIRTPASHIPHTASDCSDFNSDRAFDCTDRSAFKSHSVFFLFPLTSRHCVTANSMNIPQHVSHWRTHIGFFLADRCNISYNERGSRKWRTGGWSLSYASFPVSSYRIYYLPFIRVQGNEGKKSPRGYTMWCERWKARSEVPRQKIVRVCNMYV